MASTKRENPTTQEQQEQEQEQEKPHPKKLKSQISDNFVDNYRVVLNPADCDLAFNIEADGLTGSARNEDGFAYCWFGARGNVGITGGKFCFGCKIVSDQSVVMEDTPLEHQHVARVGISRGDDPVGSLGETECSFGYGGTKKFSNAGKFVDYGERFGVGDTIVCLVDLESKPFASIEFVKNGKRLGIAKQFDAGPRGLGVIDTPSGNLPWKSAFFPHVMLKNTVVQMQFSLEDGLVPEEGYKPWSLVVKDGKAVIGPAFSDSKDCEVIMLVGLPASGKTTWAEKWVKEHPEKRYILLGTNLALDQMKVPGLLRKSNYSERFDRLMDRATKIFNTLLSIASKVSRNYIIDQTNVYKRARMRKLKPFASFHKIAVVLFPRQEELKLRAEKRFKEMGKEVPPEAVNEMIANFELPKSKDMHGTDEYFDKVMFAELCREEAQEHLNKMKRALSSNLIPKSDHSAYSSSTSASSLPGPVHTYLGYSRPPLELQTDRSLSAGHLVPALQPNPANVHRGCIGVEQPHTADSMQPYSSTNVRPRYAGYGYSSISEPSAGPYCYSGTLNPMPPRGFYPETYPSYSNPVPRENRDYSRTYSSYAYPGPDNNYGQYGIPGYGNNAVDARSAHQPPYVSPYATPNPRPREGYHADIQHPGAAPYYPPPRYY